MKTKSQTQVALESARQELKVALERVKELRALTKFLRTDAKNERVLDRIVREEQRNLRAQKRAEKREARITKMEQRLQTLREKSLAPKNVRRKNRKASVGVIYSPEQIAALNAERGLV